MNIMDNAHGRPCALVTGATSGIGAAFAERLAQKGFELVLQGRRQHELTERAKNLERKFRTSVEIVVAELSRPKGIQEVEQRIKHLERIDMLINNAGYWEPGLFWEHSPDCLEAMIMVHNVAPVRFICAALPGMLKRDKGAIINVSSTGAYLNMVAMENYGATKAYLISFTESLHVALMGTGVRVQALIPGPTVTEFHSRLGADLTKDQKTWLRPERVADKSLGALEKNQVLCIPSLRSRLIVRLGCLLPRAVYYRVMKVMGESLKKRWDEIEAARG